MFWKALLILLVSMIPIIELRGAIPLGLGADFGLPEWLVLIITIIGNIIPIPIIYFFAKKVLNWGSTKCKWKWFKKFCDFCLKKGEKTGEKFQKRIKGGVYWALFLFVAIPIPGTGAWTGTLAASILNLEFKKTFISIFAGVIVAGIIVLLASMGVFKLILGGA
jgi:uncharacterized membrane protein